MSFFRIMFIAYILIHDAVAVASERSIPVVRANLGDAPDQISANSTLKIKLDKTPVTKMMDPIARMKAFDAFTQFDFVYGKKNEEIRIPGCNLLMLTSETNHLSNVKLGPQLHPIDLGTVREKIADIENQLELNGWRSIHRSGIRLFPFSSSNTKSFSNWSDIEDELKNDNSDPSYRIVYSNWIKDDENFAIEFQRNTKLAPNEIFDVSKHKPKYTITVEISTNRYSLIYQIKKSRK